RPPDLAPARGPDDRAGALHARPLLALRRPASDPAATAGTLNFALQAEVLRDHHPLDLVRALADLEDLLVAVEPGDRGLVHVPVAAVDLERQVRDPVRQLAGVELR